MSRARLISYDDVRHRFWGFAVRSNTEWQAEVKGILKAELKRRNVSYKQLAELLEKVGVHDSERNIANKISRGSFTAVFFVQCLNVIGCKSLRLDND